MALLKVRILKMRPDLKLVVMSAALEAARFQDYFEGAPCMEVRGRLHSGDFIQT